MNKSIFPIQCNEEHPGDLPCAMFHPLSDGMTLLDVFAAAAMHGFITRGPYKEGVSTLARASWEIAQQMMAEREKRLTDRDSAP